MPKLPGKSIPAILFTKLCLLKHHRITEYSFHSGQQILKKQQPFWSQCIETASESLKFVSPPGLLAVRFRIGNMHLDSTLHSEWLHSKNHYKANVCKTWYFSSYCKYAYYIQRNYNRPLLMIKLILSTMTICQCHSKNSCISMAGDKIT